MYSHGYNWREEPEGTSVSSLVLLLVFVGAAVFLGAMVYFRPWDDSSATSLTEVQIPPGSPAPEAAAPPPEGAPPPAQ